MQTYDVYCLLPADADLAAVLDALFYFEDVVYHGPDDVDLPIRSSREALNVFTQQMQEGEF